ENRLRELSLTLERLKAGKSGLFKQYCAQALRSRRSLPQLWSTLPPQEVGDFQHACTVLSEHARLAHSLHRQRRAHGAMRIWRYIHILLSCGAIAIISYHSLFELWMMLVIRQ